MRRRMTGFFGKLAMNACSGLSRADSKVSDLLPMAFGDEVLLNCDDLMCRFMLLHIDLRLDRLGANT